MSTIDIRDSRDAPVDRIIFGEDMNVQKKLHYQGVHIEDRDGDMILIEFSDVNNLIKALQKAQELWEL